MNVVLQYSAGCTNWKTTRRRLRAALDATGNAAAEIVLRRVDNSDDAECLRFTGSPPQAEFERLLG
jgi:hypothetical protein